MELVNRIKEAIANERQRIVHPEPDEPKRERTLQRTAAKLLIGFFAIMIILTVLSRAADSLTIAKVSVDTPQNGSLTYEVEAEGEIESSKEVSMTAETSLRVLDVFVEEGQEVKKGDQLVAFDVEDIEEQLLQAQSELQKLILQKKQQKLSNTSSVNAVDNAKNAIENAKEDYAASTQSAQRTVERAQLDLYRANEDYQNALQNAEQSNSQSRQQAINNAQAALNSAKNEYDSTVMSRDSALRLEQRKVEDAQAFLASAQSGGNTAAIEAAQKALDRALEDQNTAIANWDRSLSQAQEKLTQAQNALTAAQNSSVDGGTQTIDSARRAFENAQRALQDAIENQKKQNVAGNRAIESAEQQLDSVQKDASNKSQQSQIQQQSIDIDIEIKERKVEKFKELRENNILTAPEDGAILAIGTDVGKRTNGEELLLLAKRSGGYKFRAVLNEAQAEHIALGDEIALTLKNESVPIKVKIESLYTKSGEETTEITASLPEGNYASGEKATLEVRKRSENFARCLPISAIRRDSGGEYVLVMRETGTVLGKEYTLARVNVTVLDSDSTTAAVSSEVGPQDKIITSSSKPVDEGDRVRLSET